MTLSTNQLLLSYAIPAVVLCFLYAINRALRSWAAPGSLRYPPGPVARDMIAGNLRDLPPTFAWNTYMEWGKKYGPWSFKYSDVRSTQSALSRLQQHAIVLNSYEDNVELLERRSTIYSDRPYMSMMDLMGWLSFDTRFMAYGPTWRGHRRFFQQFFKQEVSLNYRPMQTKKVDNFYPVPFECSVTPRSEESRQLVCAAVGL